ncbi:XRE family transcriptional regulator [Mesobaculum littorinae]|uniref:XRE family transcriptional regulator n=1 Tax=Mesobaculum littorinae TaxID=2486419 RepID=A0A438AF95_9RHOB|nr:helix-turn-helix transcriptional regulator [Mesobaculum littorinae]RVV97390.1 XRE family transcriptional regulator [Mesobaculum littorinae]
MPDDQRAASNSFSDIGARLRAHRMGRGLSPGTLADRLGISRAALYRAEKGEIAKIDMLTAISAELGVSLPTLLGVGTEYIPTASGFFERMRQLEEGCDQIIGVFSPVSYLLTSDRYDTILAEVLHESLPEDAPEGRDRIAQILTILRRRKDGFRRHRPLIASIISSPDLERFLQVGMTGRNDLDAATLAQRRRAALEETRYIVSLLRDQPIGQQLGVACEPMPATSFQIMRSPAGSALTISPFRLGQQPNIGIGVGMVTRAPEALELHEGISRRLWTTALKGGEAAAHVETLIDRFGVPEE